MIGVKQTSIYNLIDEGFLVYRRPLRHKIELSLASVIAFKQATGDTEFWSNPTLQGDLQKKVKAEMDRMKSQFAGTLQGK